MMPKAIFYAPIVPWICSKRSCARLFYAGIEIQGFGIVRLVQKALASYEQLDPRFSQIKYMEQFSEL